MSLYGLSHCATFNQTSTQSTAQLVGNTYYDAERVFYQISDYFQNPAIKSVFSDNCALAAQYAYRDLAVLTASPPGSMQGYWSFPTGILMNYQRTGDPVSKQAVWDLADAAAFSRDGTPLSWTAESTSSREVAYAIVNYLDAEAAGQPRRPRLADMVNQAKDHIRQWFITKSAPYVRPFMVSLTLDALIHYYNVTGDASIPPLVKTALDGMFQNWYLPDSQSFQYTNVDTSQLAPTKPGFNTGGTGPSPDLNMLIAPQYAWYHSYSGDKSYLNIADHLFIGSVQGAYIGDPKQFSQTYKFFTNYLKYTGRPMVTDALSDTLPVARLKAATSFSNAGSVAFGCAWGSNDGSLNLACDTPLIIPHTLVPKTLTGTYQFKVMAYGVPFESIYPQMEVRVDSRTIGSVPVTSDAYAPYVFTADLSLGNHQIEITVTNPDPSKTRKLYFQGVDLDLVAGSVPAFAP